MSWGNTLLNTRTQGLAGVELALFRPEEVIISKMKCRTTVSSYLQNDMVRKEKWNRIKTMDNTKRNERKGHQYTRLERKFG